MSDDKRLDLPSRAPSSLARGNTRSSQPGGSGLSDKSKGKMVDAGVRLLGDAGKLARDLVAIQRIKNQSIAKVNEIDANTRQQVQVIRAQVEKVRVGHDGVRVRGQEIRGIIAEVTAALANLGEAEDAAARRALVAALPKLAELAVDERRR